MARFHATCPDKQVPDKSEAAIREGKFSHFELFPRVSVCVLQRRFDKLRIYQQAEMNAFIRLILMIARNGLTTRRSLETFETKREDLFSF